MRVAAILQERVRGDANLRRGRKLVAEGIRALPSATGRYLIQKVPVVSSSFPSYDELRNSDSHGVGISKSQSFPPFRVPSYRNSSLVKSTNIEILVAGPMDYKVRSQYQIWTNILPSNVPDTPLDG